ncbi:MAG TPA: flavin reductase family protein [Armatimonadota bacterium]|nr:flavin reductase family protein [Armatimonadota bacterium]HPP74838.1 flavin reductase family protein [Armatimonadota bacterium]
MARNIENALNSFTYGVYVVSGRRGERANGLTCAWVTRVSMEPALVAVAVGKPRYTHDFIKEGGAFAVSVLSENQVEIGRYFGTVSGKDEDKFAKYSHFTKTTGVPIIADCAAWVDCKLIHSYDAGDHTIFVGEVVDAGTSDAAPLVFRPGDYF